MTDREQPRTREHWTWNVLPVIAGLIMLFAIASIFFGTRDDYPSTDGAPSNSSGTSTVDKIVPKTVPQ